MSDFTIRQENSEFRSTNDSKKCVNIKLGFQAVLQIRQQILQTNCASDVTSALFRLEGVGARAASF